MQTLCSAGYLCTVCTICVLSMCVYARPLAYSHHNAVSAHHYLTVSVFLEPEWSISTHSSRPNLFCNAHVGFTDACYLDTHIMIHDKQIVIHDE